MERARQRAELVSAESTTTRARQVTRHGRWSAILLAACLMLALPVAARADSGPALINGSAVAVPLDGRPAMSLTLAVGEPATGSWFSLCTTGRSWCLHNGPLWTALHEIECSVVEGNIWYGGAWLSSGMPESTGWWAFKVVDNGSAGDLIGYARGETRGAGPCGAASVKVHAAVAGDFVLKVR